MKLDYTLQTPEERKQLVEKILEEIPDPSSAYLEILANYLILCMEKQEKKNKEIITDGHAATIAKRELSFEGLAAQFEGGEDALYDFVANDKNIIFQPKISISKKDLEDIPELRQLREAINLWEKKLKISEGREAFLIKKSLIEMRQDQYIIKNAFKPPMACTKITRVKSYPALDSEEYFSSTGVLKYSGVSLTDPLICSNILCNYEKIMKSCYGQFNSDLWCVFFDFNQLMEEALAPYPLYRLLTQLKIQNYPNTYVQQQIQQKFNVLHTVEYISRLWRNKIPKVIASKAEEKFADWYFLEKEKGTYKQCSRCGKIKLALPKFFSKNRTSKDSFYSICKKCRNKKEDKNV